MPVKDQTTLLAPCGLDKPLSTPVPAAHGQQHDGISNGQFGEEQKVCIILLFWDAADVQPHCKRRDRVQRLPYTMPCCDVHSPDRKHHCALSLCLCGTNGRGHFLDSLKAA